MDWLIDVSLIEFIVSRILFSSVTDRLWLGDDLIGLLDVHHTLNRLIDLIVDMINYGSKVEPVSRAS